MDREAQIRKRSATGYGDQHPIAWQWRLTITLPGPLLSVGKSQTHSGITDDAGTLFSAVYGLLTALPLGTTVEGQIEEVLVTARPEPRIETRAVVARLEYNRIVWTLLKR
ncbi:hypothetical protein [Nonomuraea endophytica]|uniref:Uncharacterized protein n=1 Tax=Nonomuraea endophytica TaxID=714136 RepID=A0A7W8EGX5_9ACTN|nr:hypothetical protein [Nonomuraea endophytica]MBB5078866.1 hypothetical protein [Nonomuraea endophytica]